MNEQSIQKQYNQIVSLLEDKRLKEALVQLDAFLYNSNDWTLRNRLEQIQTSYQYMLQYMKLGMKDPERHKLYRQLLADTWEIADQTRILLLDEISTHIPIIPLAQKSQPVAERLMTSLPNRGYWKDSRTKWPYRSWQTIKAWNAILKRP